MQKVTQFEILDRIDVGGMAEIFRAKNLENGEIIAIKRILPSLAGDKNFVRMFIDEAAVCMALRHPNIVRVDQIGLINDALFLSMELVDGINLQELLVFANEYHYRIPSHEAINIAIHVLNGLEYAHQCCNEHGEPLHLIHRDISPPNILLGYNGDVKITDFGLVKSKAQISKTVPGLIKGKFSYLSPEAAYGESIDLRSDLYAVGIIMWEMLTARPLFNDPVEMKILDLVRKSIIPPISNYNPNVEPDLERIIMKALARNRVDRYRTAAEFAADLRELMHKIGNPKSELSSIIKKIKPPKYDAHKETFDPSQLPQQTDKCSQKSNSLESNETNHADDDHAIDTNIISSNNQNFDQNSNITQDAEQDASNSTLRSNNQTSPLEQTKSKSHTRIIILVVILIMVLTGLGFVILL